MADGYNSTFVLSIVVPHHRRRFASLRDLREQETVESPTRDCQRITRLVLNAEDGAVLLFVPGCNKW